MASFLEMAYAIADWVGEQNLRHPPKVVLEFDQYPDAHEALLMTRRDFSTREWNGDRKDLPLYVDTPFKMNGLEFVIKDTSRKPMAHAYAYNPLDEK